MEESTNKYILQWRELVLKAAKALELRARVQGKHILHKSD